MDVNTCSVPVGCSPRPTDRRQRDRVRRWVISPPHPSAAVPDDDAADRAGDREYDSAPAQRRTGCLSELGRHLPRQRRAPVPNDVRTGREPRRCRRSHRRGVPGRAQAAPDVGVGRRGPCVPARDGAHRPGLTLAPPLRRRDHDHRRRRRPSRARRTAHRIGRARTGSESSWPSYPIATHVSSSCASSTRARSERRLTR